MVRNSIGSNLTVNIKYIWRENVSTSLWWWTRGLTNKLNRMRRFWHVLLRGEVYADKIEVNEGATLDKGRMSAGSLIASQGQLRSPVRLLVCISR